NAPRDASASPALRRGPSLARDRARFPDRLPEGAAGAADGRRREAQGLGRVDRAHQQGVLTMRKFLAACAVLALAASGSPSAAQDVPGSEDIIKKLEPQQPRVRSLKPRGVKVEEGPNS